MSEEKKLFKPPARKCLRHEIKGSHRDPDCALCGAYAEAEDNFELARKIYLKRPKRIAPVEIEVEKPAEKVLLPPESFPGDLPLFDEKYFRQLNKELINQEEDYVH